MKSIWEIDALRGFALVLMLVFNWSFLLKFYDIFTISQSWIYWNIFPVFIGALFITIAGVSATLSKDNFRRGLQVFSFGMLIALVTYFLYPENFIFFGVLHLIGFSIMASKPFLKTKHVALFLGVLAILAGFLIEPLILHRSLAWIGFGSILTLDYFPVFPWFGFFLIGIFIGDCLYEKKKSRVKLPTMESLTTSLRYIGTRTLWVYLLHQPFLMLLLKVMGYNFFF